MPYKSKCKITVLTNQLNVLILSLHLVFRWVVQSSPFPATSWVKLCDVLVTETRVCALRCVFEQDSWRVTVPVAPLSHLPSIQLEI